MFLSIWVQSYIFLIQNSKFNAAFKRGQCKKFFYLAERSREKTPKVDNILRFYPTKKAALGDHNPVPRRCALYAAEVFI